MIATCNLCPADSPEESVPFRVPWDGHGQALMAEHMATTHGERGPLNALAALSEPVLGGRRMAGHWPDEPL